MTFIKRATVGAIIATAALGAVATGTTHAALPVCHDSNGSRPGGSVYVVDGHATGCDVVHGQRLHVTHVRTLSACDDMGGRYAAAQRICWDVDY